jgi:hypothetical protein
LLCRTTDLLDELVIGTTARDTGGDPRLVSLIQDAQGPAVLAGNGRQAPGIRPLGASCVHRDLFRLSCQLGARTWCAWPTCLATCS